MTICINTSSRCLLNACSGYTCTSCTASRVTWKGNSICRLNLFRKSIDNKPCNSQYEPENPVKHQHTSWPFSILHTPPFTQVRLQTNWPVPPPPPVPKYQEKYEENKSLMSNCYFWFLTARSVYDWWNIIWTCTNWIGQCWWKICTTITIRTIINTSYEIAWITSTWNYNIN